MKVIYKYTLMITDVQLIGMPQGAEILSAQEQDGSLVLWAMVEPSNPPEERAIYIVGTGNHIHSPMKRHISTVVMSDRTFVWHVFE